MQETALPANPSQDFFGLSEGAMGRAANPVSVLLVEQKLAIALDISQRLYVMGHGAIVFEGSPAQLALLMDESNAALLSRHAERQNLSRYELVLEAILPDDPASIAPMPCSPASRRVPRHRCA